MICSSCRTMIKFYGFVPGYLILPAYL
ncbi:MAG: hypothetical protein EGQ00_09945 [Parabacteroides johnsonii]|nr:hypothetical protein [Parabacteroides johnsonii]